MWLVQSNLATYNILQIWSEAVTSLVNYEPFLGSSRRPLGNFGTAGFSPETRWIWEPTEAPWGSSSPVIGDGNMMENKSFYNIRGSNSAQSWMQIQLGMKFLWTKLQSC